MVIYYIVFPHYTCDEVPPVKIIEEGQHFGGGHFSEGFRALLYPIIQLMRLLLYLIFSVIVERN